MLTETLLEVRNLTVQFRTEAKQQIRPVDEARFDIAPGEGVGLLGESGSGKTTLALSLLNLLPPNASIVAGSVQFRGRELLSLTDRELRRIRGAEISMISQEPGVALNPVLRVGDQIAEVVHAHRDWSWQRCRVEAELLIARVHLSGTRRIYSAYPHQLSGGERQRVAIAQALACRPALIVADEPTTALDATLQVEILALLKELMREFGTALLLITHNPGVLAGLADRVVVMYGGRIIEQGKVDDVLADPLHPYTQGLLRSLPSPANRKTSSRSRHLPVLEGAPPDLAHLPAGCCFSPRCPFGAEACMNRRPTTVELDASRRVECFAYGD